ncbi:MAG: hypothetical protein QOD63_1959 [Actinomycetota bacterium]|nr:hypothetical protein [Actinomycetota bacterium]
MARAEIAEGGPAAGGYRRKGVRSCQTTGMERRRWLNQAQPQTLQIAVFLLYLNAASFVIFTGLLSSRFSRPDFELLTAFAVYGAQVAAAYGIANERRWGYGLAVGIAGLALVLALIGSAIFRRNLIGLMFDVALLALLLHPQSRDYQRIWFK